MVRIGKADDHTTVGNGQPQRNMEDSERRTEEVSSAQASSSQGVGEDGRSCSPSLGPGLDNISGDASANDVHTRK